MYNLKTIITFIFALSLPISASSFSPNPSFGVNSKVNMSSSSALSSKPFVVCVEAEIKPDRMDDFLDIIEKDAVGSRGEPGCLRFGE